MATKVFGIAGVLLGIGASQVAHAFVIDTFSDVFATRYDTIAGSGSEGVYNTGSTCWLGSRLLLNYQYASPIGGIATTEVNGGWFGSNTPLSTNLSAIYYGAAGWNQGAQTLSYFPGRDENLSGFVGVRITVEAAQAGSVLGWDMYDSNLSVGEFSTYRHTLTSNVTSTTTFDFMFASPTSQSSLFTTSRVDYARVSMNLFNVPSGGYAISRIEFIPVPEPASMTAIAVGLAALARRKSKRA